MVVVAYSTAILYIYISAVQFGHKKLRVISQAPECPPVDAKLWEQRLFLILWLSRPMQMKSQVKQIWHEECCLSDINSWRPVEGNSLYTPVSNLLNELYTITGIIISRVQPVTKNHWECTGKHLKRADVIKSPQYLEQMRTSWPVK